ncbi:hypothetical protein IST455A_00475 [Burkholderia multivorans]|uniref:hypothetical protein n=1 Tax=Burkholderia multivorans TaxID=87883 RepID=UPI001998CEA4|nr:hypothetical protein [Burkholderia multivorans]CAB5280782.1 hypothetical protein IST455B_00362 [Burkholderia multivorans]CAB5282752.1 hypothetical protein IST453_00650 [Burkholderia multivorans]CAB5295588.1 hypothetical protein IST455A_00475 [Burkholderia multivorans]CAB5296885.1 hypothetical protein IST424_02829 [Burkholderia multivorans]CAB5297846.1 hypothetical protein IST419_02834 [Burkholderia multivorans]
MSGLFDQLPPRTSDPSTEPINNAQAGILKAGVRTISHNQQLTFTLYQQYVLPLDGMVYWIRQADTTFTVQGSLHVTNEQQQRPSESYAQNTVIFTSLNVVSKFQDIAPSTMWVCEYDGMLFAFNRRTMRYWQTDLNHYAGTAVFPTMRTQFLDSNASIPTSKILSNSIPIWLSLTGPLSAVPGYDQPLAVFGEYLVAANQQPPYIAVEIQETTSIEPQPRKYAFEDDTVNPPVYREFMSQLKRDRVLLHLYGFDSDHAMAYLDYLMTFFLNQGNTVMGLMSGPNMKDMPIIQSEYNIRGPKKTIELEVSYQTFKALDYAITLLRKAQPNFTVPSLYSDQPGYLVPPFPPQK